MYVGLLRAVNLGSGSTIHMADLQAAMRAAGFDDVRTWLQSGNVVFRDATGETAQIEQRIERHLAQRCQLSTQVFVRTAAEWREVIRGNPFPSEAKVDPSHLLVATLREAPSSDAWGALRAAIVGRERTAGAGRHAYIVYPDGIGRSKLTTGVIERALATRSTSRNWNTVTRLGELAGA